MAEEVGMPWREICPMDQRAAFIVECLRGELAMSELCRKYEISRKTGYKWWRRIELDGRVDLADRSHAAHWHPNATPDEVVTMLVSARKAHPTWGPRKLVHWLEVRHPRLRLPSPSTVGTILKRQGMLRARRARPRATPYAAPFLGCDAPNTVWCADFKGSFVMRNGRRCNALTISDAYSRYLLRCEAMSHIDDPRVRPVFESAFAEFGLPAAIRTDNGPPFSTVAPGGLSRLAIWWIKLGIRAERIAPGAPQQNGRHERMHRTLKEDTAQPPERTLDDQQRAFDRFRRIYNEERPHEALGQQPPWTVYTRSRRAYPVKLREPAYPSDFIVRSVRHNGLIRWRGRHVYLAETLAREAVGFQPIADDRWRVYFADVPLGVLIGARFQRDRGNYRSRRIRPPIQGDQL
jgi:transposase InsO family protein